MKKRLIAMHIGILVILLEVGAIDLLAQNFQGMNTLQNMASEFQGGGKYAVNIAFVVCGIAGALCLIPATIKALKGEAQSKDAITSVGLGLITAFLILAVIKAVMAFT
jgi:hypothetical protein